jgi:glutamine cyclotransferase
LRVVRRLPHPARGFTQGLIIDGGTVPARGADPDPPGPPEPPMVWESTGGYGASALCRYWLGAPHTDGRAPLAPEYFGEGICRAGDHIWQLTWRERVALRWDPLTLTLAGTVSYNREGWGICNIGHHIVTSDGSSELVRRDPATLQPLGVILVRCEGHRVGGLNDLEWAAGRIWANMAGRPYLAGIDPDSGEVTDVVDARRARERHFGDPEAIMNGIASLDGGGAFLLTGKGWRSIYHVRLMQARPRKRPVTLIAGQR